MEKLETAVICKDAIVEYFEDDPASLKDAIELIKSEPKEFAELLAAKLKEKLDRIIVNENLCPDCLEQLETVCEQEAVGEYCGTMAYQDVPVEQVCECGYREVI